MPHVRLVACVLILSTQLFSADRPKIGVALSGGGALGLAHIGVIRWLEQNRVPIDYIAGTSMGGLVGGTYATGLDSDEIERFVSEIEWTEALSGGPSYEQLTFRRKEDARDYPSAFEFGLRDGFQLPVALNSGHEVGLILNRIALPYSTLEDFGQLPTPFRCVAVDLMGGSEVVLSSGPLGDALRATMAIPGVFAPVRRDGMVLVDGGLLNNLPVDVVRKMGADVVIAVDVGSQPVEREDLNSIIGIASRALDVMIRVNVERNARLADYVLRPRTKEVTTLDFSKPDVVIAAGYDHAVANGEEIAKLGVSVEEWHRYLEFRRSRLRPREFTPAFVQVAGETPIDEPRIEDKLDDFAGQPLKEELLADKLTNVTGLGLYDTASYRKAIRNSEEGLGVTIGRKPHGPPFFKPIVKINAGQTGDITFEVAGRLTFYDVWRGNNEWRNDFSIGRLNLISSELYQYLGESRWFVAPRGSASYETQFIYSGGNRIADYGITDVHVGGDLGYNTGLSSEFRFGYQVGWQRANVRTGDPALPRVDGLASALSGRWTLDRRDSAMIATSGYAATASAKWQVDAPDSPERFKQFAGSIAFAHPWSRRWSSTVNFSAGGTAGGEAGPLQEFTMGGPARIGALDLNERRGNHFVYSSVGVLRLLKENPGGFLSRIFAVGFYEGGDAFDSNPDWVHSGSLGVTAETSFGVFYFGGSVGSTGGVNLYLSLGKFF